MKNLILVLLIFSLVGCANHVPYTKRQKVSLAFNILANAADVITTETALNKGAVEMNPIFGEKPEIGWLISGKLLVIGFAYMCGEFYPEYREWWHYGYGAIGGSCAVHNYGWIKDN